MNLFLSKFKNKIDVKGRVSIPVSFRNILLKDISQRMFCYPSLDAQAIDAGGQSLSKEIYALMDNLDPYSDERDYLSTALFGLSEELKIDNDGRVILSDALIDHAQIKDEVTFVGLGFTVIVIDAELVQPKSSSIETVNISPFTIPTTLVVVSSKVRIFAFPLEVQFQRLASPTISVKTKVSSIQTGELL